METLKEREEKVARRWMCGSDEYRFYLRKEHSNVPVGAVHVKLLYANGKNKWIITSSVVHPEKEQFRYDVARAKTLGRINSVNEKTVIVTDENKTPHWNDVMKHFEKQRQLRAVLKHYVDFTRAEMIFTRLCHKLDRSMIDE